MNRKKISLCVFIILCLMVIICSFEYRRVADKDRIMAFRKVYGTIGNRKNIGTTLELNLISFDENVDFLDDVSKLHFDDADIQIKGLDVAIKAEEYDMTVYSVGINIDTMTTGKHDITELVFNDHGNELRFDIGKISIVTVDDTVSLNHGGVPDISNKTAVLYFSKNQDKDFIIKDLLLADDWYVSYTFDKDLPYCNDRDLYCRISCENKLAFGDVFLIRPVFVLDFSGERKYFIPLFYMQESSDMTYKDAREYVKNATCK